MKIIVFCHPSFERHQSMPRYARLLADGMRARGHPVECWYPKAIFHRFGINSATRKWLGYLDQFLVFPQVVRNRLRTQSEDTLYVFADQALGPWVPLVANRPHVIHCHDFLAQRSALGEFLQNPVSRTGKVYQSFIRRGYSKGKNFISVSAKTRDDLHRFLPGQPKFSEVIYNGLNQAFRPSENVEATRLELSQSFGLDLAHGYLLHVGGNTWYKNRLGVMEIYDAWRKSNPAKAIPLLMIGEAPTNDLLRFQERMIGKEDVHFFSGVDDSLVRLAYQGASVFLFPSLEEGFGWPIAEAMASGCPVITTDSAPMTEVAGDAAVLIPRRPEAAGNWPKHGADAIARVMNLPEADRISMVEKGLQNASRFDPGPMLDRIEKIYHEVLAFRVG